MQAPGAQLVTVTVDAPFITNANYARPTGSSTLTGATNPVEDLPEPPKEANPGEPLKLKMETGLSEVPTY